MMSNFFIWRYGLVCDGVVVLEDSVICIAPYYTVFLTLVPTLITVIRYISNWIFFFYIWIKLYISAESTCLFRVTGHRWSLIAIMPSGLRWADISFLTYSINVDGHSKRQLDSQAPFLTTTDKNAKQGGVFDGQEDCSIWTL